MALFPLFLLLKKRTQKSNKAPNKSRFHQKYQPLAQKLLQHEPKSLYRGMIVPIYNYFHLLYIMNEEFQVSFQASKNTWAGEMAQRVKVLATKADDLSLIPSTHIVEGVNQPLNILWCFQR